MKEEELFLLKEELTEIKGNRRICIIAGITLLILFICISILQIVAYPFEGLLVPRLMLVIGFLIFLIFMAVAYKFDFDYRNKLKEIKEKER